MWLIPPSARGVLWSSWRYRGVVERPVAALAATAVLGDQVV